MTSRTWPILIVGFGALVVLIGLSGFGASRRAEEIYREILSIHESYRQSAQLLNEIRSDINVSSVLVRDYLLDPSHLTADMHRRQLLEIRSSMAKRLEELDRLTLHEEGSALQLLRIELDAYWNSLDPIFDWTPQQKLALSSLFLRQRVLPRRDAVVFMAREIRGLNEAHLKRQQQEINRSQQEFRNYLSRMMGIVVSLGLLVAAATIFRITRLERRAEEQRRRTERAEQELRRLSQQLVQAQEAERRSISRELHDEVGQMLTALRMEVGNLKQLRTAPEEQFREHLEATKHLTEQTMRAVRDLAMGLRPSMLDDLGLGPALEWQAREFSRRSSIPVTVQIDGTLDNLPDSHRTCVYRVVQEALTNCARHAQATKIRVALHGSPGWLSLAIQDDGVGIADQEASGCGLGLIGIEERVRELGGAVSIFSQPQKGTLLKVEVPLPGQVAL